ncbi:MAG: DUF6436 domain-containing protein [Saccharospirillaceae bacterium]|nr:DUF6436 domain-containing protein [Saccharospirillaceae bacterium]MCD8532758.1 DUF6436 domain-containing protein [Saccharospirillaceae bacterium]
MKTPEHSDNRFAAGGAPASANTAKNVWLILLVSVWLLATLAGLWWFQQQNVRPFVAGTDDPRFWQAGQVNQMLQPLLQQLPPTPTIQTTEQTVVLLHFWNPDCLCNQLSQRHFDGLISRFSAEQLRIVVVAAPGTTDEQLHQFRQLNGRRMEVMRQPQGIDLPLPSSPALALLNSRGELGYFGAYGFGALCTVANDDFFPNIVRELSTKGYGPFANVAGDGCFCAWPNARPSAG